MCDAQPECIADCYMIHWVTNYTCEAGALLSVVLCVMYLSVQETIPKPYLCAFIHKHKICFAYGTAGRYCRVAQRGKIHHLQRTHQREGASRELPVLYD